MKVSEIFYSIQGESYFAGRPCTFVRLSGCNLRCSYCDTRYAYQEGIEVSVEEVVAEAERYGCTLVEITGGEPLLQPETPLLAEALIEKGYTVLVETNGSLDIRVLPSRAICIMDLKCPSSGMSDKMDFRNLDALDEKDELKFVIQDRSDYVWAKQTLLKFPLRPWRVSFSPVFGVLPLEELASWLLEDRLEVRLQPQLHKCIWPDASRGR